MKIKLFLITSCILYLSLGMFASAYEPNAQEQEELSNLKNQIAPLIENDNQILRSFYEQTRKLHPHFTDQKTAYHLEHLRDYLLTKLQMKKALATDEAKNLKTNFLAQYQGSGLATADPLSEKCYGRYQTLDNLSFAYDFPTALTIAVRYRESTCGYYLPKNKNGPFQITSKDYGTGEITKEIFETTIKDFLTFAKRKIDRYNSKNPDTPIVLNYKNFNYKDLYKFAGLYNGLKGATVYGDIGPAAPKYFFEKMTGEFEDGKRNGLFLHFLRAIERELQQ